MRRVQVRVPDSVRIYIYNLRRHLSDRITGDHNFQLELLLLIFASGIMDILTFFKFHVFTYNQAANIVIAFIRLFNIDPKFAELGHILLSLLAYVSGVMFPISLGWSTGSNKRGCLIGLVCLQMAMISATAVLVHMRHLHPGTTNKGYDLGTIGMLAFVAGSQVAFAWSVYVPDAWRQLSAAMDMGAVKLQNRSLSHRFGSLVFLILGLLVGAVFYKQVSPVLALCMSAVVRGVVVVALFVHPVVSTRDLEIELQNVE